MPKLNTKPGRFREPDAGFWLCYNAGMGKPFKPPNPATRIVKFVQTGPQAMLWRLQDDWHLRNYGASRRKHSEVTTQLHVGGQHSRKGYKRLLKRGITAIVNMREEKYSDELKGIGGERHLHLPTIDHTPPSIEDMERGVNFIAREIEEYRGKVYIHCRAGIGRAPSMAAAYLISTGMTRKEALKTIERARPFISLNQNQKRVLDQFEAYWRARIRQPSCQS